MAQLGIVVVGALLFVGCSSGSESKGATNANNASNADGAALYAQSCASCHGSDLRGTDQGPSHLSVVYEAGHHSDDSFRSAIESGATAHHWRFGDMAPVPGLTENEVDAIIKYIREQQEAQGLEPYPAG